MQLYEQNAGVGHVSVTSLKPPLGGNEGVLGARRPRRPLLAGPLPTLPSSVLPVDATDTSDEPPAFDFHVAGTVYLGVAQPVTLGNVRAGALVVAEPESALRSRWLQLFWELALAFGIGIPVAGVLVVYYSRRIAGPLEELATAADEVAAGHYDVAVPERTWGSEVERLATRFHEMTTRLAESEQLSRNFLMSVSHELRTPLTAIRGHVAALREGVFEDEAAQQLSLEVVSEEALRLERLVGDVLDLAKLDARRFALLREEVDMRALCERAYATFAEEAKARDIEYDLELGEGAVLITDGDRVLQIVTNLLANALHWTPAGGRVDLGLGDGERRGDGRRSPTRARESSRTQTERIFRPFWSGDGGGTGLGLTIARELALALGGRLELHSEPGQGSRFVLVATGDGQPA